MHKLCVTPNIFQISEVISILDEYNFWYYDLYFIFLFQRVMASPAKQFKPSPSKQRQDCEKDDEKLFIKAKHNLNALVGIMLQIKAKKKNFEEIEPSILDLLYDT